jgi:hypothetical protein
LESDFSKDAAKYRSVLGEVGNFFLGAALKSEAVAAASDFLVLKLRGYVYASWFDFVTFPVL